MSYRPYAPAKTVIAALRQSRRGNLPNTMDPEFLRGRGLSPAIASRVSNTLRFLGLVDQYYEPRSDLRALARAADAEYGKLLERLLRRAYSDIFQLAHPSKHAQDEIIRAFARYEPASQHYRMAILFLALCREAGIPVQEQLRLPSSREDPRTRRAGAVRPQRGRSRGKAAAPAKESRVLWDSFARLPKPGGLFPRAEQEAWLEGMRSALRLEYRDEEEPTGESTPPEQPTTR